MSFHYGTQSALRLATCHPKLQEVANLAIQQSPVDFTIVHGWRGEEEQNELVRIGVSETPWPTSKHNHRHRPAPGEEEIPYSLAVDFGPWIDRQIPWDDTHAFAVIAGVWFAAAARCDAELRWGGDWDLDGSTTDQTFMDYGHLELRI